jgi:predicted molibdopterin-dependent oxidoreductase YjgC
MGTLNGYDGTFTSTERRIQLLRPVLASPGEARPDWRILCGVGQRLDAHLGRPGPTNAWAYSSTAAIMEELVSVTPSYGGIRHERLAGGGLVWPCPSLDHSGTPILHAAGFTRGRGRFHPVTPLGPAEGPDAEYPLVLTTGRILYQYHTGTMTRRSKGLAWREPRGWAEINPRAAAAAGVQDGGPVTLEGRRGTVHTEARLSEHVPPGVVFLALHWREAPANLLTQDFALDPAAKIPEYKVCAVRIAAA